MYLFLVASLAGGCTSIPAEPYPDYPEEPYLVEFGIVNVEPTKVARVFKLRAFLSNEIPAGAEYEFSVVLPGLLFHFRPPPGTKLTGRQKLEFRFDVGTDLPPGSYTFELRGVIRTDPVRYLRPKPFELVIDDLPPLPPLSIKFLIPPQVRPTGTPRQFELTARLGLRELKFSQLEFELRDLSDGLFVSRDGDPEHRPGDRLRILFSYAPSTPPGTHSLKLRIRDRLGRGAPIESDRLDISVPLEPPRILTTPTASSTDDPRRFELRAVLQSGSIDLSAFTFELVGKYAQLGFGIDGEPTIVDTQTLRLFITASNKLEADEYSLQLGVVGIADKQRVGLSKHFRLNITAPETPRFVSTPRATMPESYGEFDVRAVLSMRGLDLADFEVEVRTTVGDVEVPLVGEPTVVDGQTLSLLLDAELVLSAGTHELWIRMSWEGAGLGTTSSAPFKITIPPIPDRLPFSFNELPVAVAKGSTRNFQLTAKLSGSDFSAEDLSIEVHLGNFKYSITPDSKLEIVDQQSLRFEFSVPELIPPGSHVARLSMGRAGQDEVLEVSRGFVVTVEPPVPAPLLEILSAHVLPTNDAREFELIFLLSGAGSDAGEIEVDVSLANDPTPLATSAIEIDGQTLSVRFGIPERIVDGDHDAVLRVTHGSIESSKSVSFSIRAEPPEPRNWLLPLILAGCAVLVAALVGFGLRRRRRPPPQRKPAHLPPGFDTKKLTPEQRERVMEGVKAQDVVDREKNLTKRFRVDRIGLNEIGFFDDLNWAVRPNINILLGRNGFGKTLFLRHLAALLRKDSAHSGELFGNAQPATGVSSIQFSSDTESDSKEIIRTASHFKCSPGPVPILGIPDVRFLNKSASALNPASDEFNDLARHGAHHFLEQLPYSGVVSELFYRLGLDSTSGSRPELFDFLEDSVRRLTEDEFKFDKPERFGGSGFKLPVRMKGIAGTVPLQAASQGTLSILAMFGLIHGFLKELGRDVGVPIAKRQAIVLIDEVDAHLHPVWQQKIVTALRESFPNVQFFLTSHSPLVVAGCLKDEVAVLRAGTGDTFRLVPLANDFVGWPPERILEEIFEVEEFDDHYAYFTSPLEDPDELEQRIDELCKSAGNEEAIDELQRRVHHIRAAAEREQERIYDDEREREIDRLRRELRRIRGEQGNGP